MILRACLFLVFSLSCAATLRADLILEQQYSETNKVRNVTIKIHGDKMRMDEGDGSMSVIVDLKTRDSFTLVHKEKSYLQQMGATILRRMESERRHYNGTNEIALPPKSPVATGKIETINGQDAELYTWSGAEGLAQKLWVVKPFPNYEMIRLELGKIDIFNEGGPHRNAQPMVSLLPGMVVKSENTMRRHTVTNMLVSVKIETVPEALFELPGDYSLYKPPGRDNKPDAQP